MNSRSSNYSVSQNAQYCLKPEFVWQKSAFMKSSFFILKFLPLVLIYIWVWLTLKLGSKRWWGRIGATFKSQAHNTKQICWKTDVLCLKAHISCLEADIEICKDSFGIVMSSAFLWWQKYFDFVHAILRKLHIKRVTHTNSTV